MLTAFKTPLILTKPHADGTFIIPILQTRKPKLSKVNDLALVHTAITGGVRIQTCQVSTMMNHTHWRETLTGGSESWYNLIITRRWAVAQRGMPPYPTTLSKLKAEWRPGAGSSPRPPGQGFLPS